MAVKIMLNKNKLVEELVKKSKLNLNSQNNSISEIAKRELLRVGGWDKPDWDKIKYFEGINIDGEKCLTAGLYPDGIGKQGFYGTGIERLFSASSLVIGNYAVAKDIDLNSVYKKTSFDELKQYISDINSKLNKESKVLGFGGSSTNNNYLAGDVLVADVKKSLLSTKADIAIVTYFDLGSPRKFKDLYSNETERVTVKTAFMSDNEQYSGFQNIIKQDFVLLNSIINDAPIDFKDKENLVVVYNI